MLTMEKTQIDAEKAIEIVKVHFEKMKGADVQVAGRKLIDWLDFDVMSKTTRHRRVACCPDAASHPVRRVVFEHARKYYTFQNKMVDSVHWLQTSGIFSTFQRKKKLITS